jgi:hypothetical protein
MQVLHKHTYEFCTIRFLFARFEDLTAGNIKTATLRDVTRCSLVNR